jgi:aryl-alcohol dehydrogenase-like predicted oxidoreductase
MKRALEACGAPVIASFVLAGGALTGKYDRDAATGRAAGNLDDPHYASGVRAGRDVAALARELETSPAALAIAFALGNPNVASVLFGATSPEQVRENAAAQQLVDRFDDDLWARLAAIGAG